jgi:preprotein translocase subunit Sec61beta
MAEKINMPAGFGGLMRYSEEYKSKLMLKPSHVITFIILTIVFATALRVFFPIAG